MTQPNDNHAASSVAATGRTSPGRGKRPDGSHPPPVPDAERIAAELAALGEDPAADDEFAFTTAAAVDVSALGDDPDVRTTATLIGLSTWQAPMQGLMPLERHRVWRQIASRAVPTVADPEQPAANGAAGWRGLVAGLALVAGVALMPSFRGAPVPTADQRAATNDMGTAARQVIELLPGEQDGSRARALAQGYRARLSATRGQQR